MELVVPSWFKGRQGKAEAVGADVYKLTAPNLPPRYITIRKGDNGLWMGVLRSEPDGPVVAVTPPELDAVYDAWEAAFELYRTYVVF